jgi:transcriptional regulator with XRE-family HTH domain
MYSIIENPILPVKKIINYFSEGAMYSINKQFLATVLKTHTAKVGGIRPLCKLLGIATSSYYNYLNELTSPDMSFLENIAELTKTPLRSFFNSSNLSSEAPPISEDPDLNELIAIYHEIDDQQRLKLLEYARDRKALSQHNRTNGNDIQFKKTKQK